MIDRLLLALIRSKNDAADEVLLEALRLGSEREQRLALDALLRRKTPRGLRGVLGLYESLPPPLRLRILDEVKTLYPALRECGRNSQPAIRLAAMKLIALGRQGKLAYVLAENLHDSDETVARTAAEALVGLARWAATETKSLQKGLPPAAAAGAGSPERFAGASGPADPEPRGAALASYRALNEQRPEIEATVARALDVHRGKHGQELLRAALLLCDSPGSRILSILTVNRHGGQSPLVRRLQQPPASESVEAFLLGASHGNLRNHFAPAFARIDEAPVLDAMLRRTYWLKDHCLQLCMHQVQRGIWWGEADLKRDAGRRPAEEAARIGDWIVASGADDVVQDELLDVLRVQSADSFPARLRVFRAVAGRKRGPSVALLKRFFDDGDERLVRMAAREIVRRRPADFDNILLKLMSGAPASARRVASRAIGQVGFENFWRKFDRLNKPTRKQAGRAMLKILPDAMNRLRRRLAAGPVDQRLKAMQMAQELELGEPLRDTLVELCADPDPKLRSKAVALAVADPNAGDEALFERLLNDPDARVRANAIEALEARRDPRFVPVLARRARSSNGRERANALKALHGLRVGQLTEPLRLMLRDPRSEHRISGMWALHKSASWQLLGEVGRLARADADLRVRRYALELLRSVAEMAKAAKAG